MDSDAALFTTPRQLRIDQVVYELQTAGDQAADLLETTQNISETLEAARNARYLKADLLEPDEKLWIDNTAIARADQAMHNVAALIEPARIPGDASKVTSLDVGAKTMFILRDQPRVATLLARLTVAAQALNSALVIMAGRGDGYLTTLARTSQASVKRYSHGREPPSYEESEFLKRHRRRSRLQQSSITEQEPAEIADNTEFKREEQIEELSPALPTRPFQTSPRESNFTRSPHTNRARSRSRGLSATSRSDMHERTNSRASVNSFDSMASAAFCATPVSAEAARAVSPFPTSQETQGPGQEPGRQSLQIDQQRSRQNSEPLDRGSWLNAGRRSGNLGYIRYLEHGADNRPSQTASLYSPYKAEVFEMEQPDKEASHVGSPDGLGISIPPQEEEAVADLTPHASISSRGFTVDEHPRSPVSRLSTPSLAESIRPEVPPKDDITPWARHIALSPPPHLKLETTPKQDAVTERQPSVVPHISRAKSVEPEMAHEEEEVGAERSLTPRISISSCVESNRDSQGSSRGENKVSDEPPRISVLSLEEGLNLDVSSFGPKDEEKVVTRHAPQISVSSPPLSAETAPKESTLESIIPEDEERQTPKSSKDTQSPHETSDTPRASISSRTESLGPEIEHAGESGFIEVYSAPNQAVRPARSRGRSWLYHKTSDEALNDKPSIAS